MFFALYCGRFESPLEMSYPNTYRFKTRNTQWRENLVHTSISLNIYQVRYKLVITSIVSNMNFKLQGPSRGAHLTSVVC